MQQLVTPSPADLAARADLAADAPGKRARIREAVEALKLLDPGPVEIRAFAPKTSSDKTESGIFDNLAAIQEAALAANERGFAVCYQSGLLKSGKRVTNALSTGAAIKDDDIEYYRGLNIDIDRRSSGGAPATREELAESLAIALTMIKELIMMGFPRPTILLSSGNGVQILWDLRLPASDRPLIERWMRVMDEAYSTPTHKIDLSIANPSRVLRLAGTGNFKGTATAECPHRQAVLLSLDLLPESDAPPLTRETLVDVLDCYECPDDMFGCDIDAERPELEPVAHYGHDLAPSAAAPSNGVPMSGIDRAKRWLATREPSVQGQHGDDHLRNTALVLVVRQGRWGLGVSEATDLLLNEWNPYCSPPWDPRDILGKVRRAWAYASNKGLFDYTDDGKPSSSAPTTKNGKAHSANGSSVRPEGTPVNNEWGTPMPLVAQGLPDFPVDKLPRIYREVVEALARETESPLTYAATTVLGVLATCIAGHIRVHVGGNHYTEAIVWPVAVGSAGSGKSPSYRPIIRPLLEAQEYWAGQSEDRIRRAETKRELAEMIVKRAAAAAEKDPESSELAAALDKAKADRDCCPILSKPRLLFGDSTNEAVVRQMRQNHGIAAHIKDEAGFLTRQTKPESDIDPLLAGYDRDGYGGDRIKRGETDISGCRVVICALPQHQPMRRLLADERLVERGFIDRMLISQPPELVGRKFDGPPAPEELMFEYRTAVTDLLYRTRGNDGSKAPAEMIVGITADAREAFLEFRRRNESRIGEGRRYDAIRGYMSKAADKAIRLAAILYAAEEELYEGASIPLSYVERGIKIVEDYYLPHAIKVFGLEPVDADVVHSRAILAKLIAKGVTTDTLDRIRRATRIPADSLHSALDHLEECGWVRCVQEGTSGRPRYRYTVHPKAAEYFVGEARI